MCVDVGERSGIIIIFSRQKCIANRDKLKGRRRCNFIVSNRLACLLGSRSGGSQLNQNYDILGQKFRRFLGMLEHTLASVEIT